MATDQAKETRLSGRVRAHFYPCYTGNSDQAPYSSTATGTTSFDLNGETEAVCGAFTVEPGTWRGCEYIVVSFQFTNVTNINEAWFNYGIGTVTDTLEVPV